MQSSRFVDRGRRSKTMRKRRTRLFMEHLEDRTMPHGAMIEPPLPSEPNSYDPHTILVRFRPEAGHVNANAILAGTSSKREFSLVPGLRVIHLGEGVSVEKALHAYRENPNVLYAEPNGYVHTLLTPNDPDYVNGNLYGMDKISAPQAWNISTGGTSILVAVIDTGIDYTHPDLADNIWINPGEIPNNGTDDDNNGYVDDVHGYDFVGWEFGGGDSDPYDDHYHGTHVAGTIGAVGNNGTGVVGVNWTAKIAAVKFLDSGGGGSWEGAIAAIDYAVTIGARLSNNSWGGSEFSAALYDAVKAARDAGHLFVAASGNSGTDADVNPLYPAGFSITRVVGGITYPGLDNIISVAATDSADNRAGFSNWGLTSSHLGAPGVDVLSTMPGNSYGYLSGTSMATPHVAGTAALAWGLAGSAGYAEIRDAILSSVDPNTDLRTTGPTPVATGGRLNAFKTVQAVGMAVAGSDPTAGSIIDTQPLDFVVHFAHPYDASTVQAGDLTVNGMAASTWTPTDTDTVTFHFAPSPVSTQGLQTMQIAEDALAADPSTGLPDPLIHEWTATFRYDLVRMEVVSTYPAGPLAGVPMTIFKVNLNEAVDPLSVSESDLTLSQGTVLGYSLENSDTTIRFTLGGITSEGTLDASIAAGALTDDFGNPNLPFASTYTLVTSMGVYTSTPGEGDIVSPLPPTDFVINFTLPYNTVMADGAVLDAADLTVNDKPATSVETIDGDNDTVIFHFSSAPTPPSVEGEWTMHMAAGVVAAAAGSGLPDPANIEWTATFRYDALPMEVVSTVPSDGSAVELPLTTFDVNLNEPVDAASVSESDLALSQGFVTAFAVLPDAAGDNTIIRFTLSGISTEGTLSASIAAGALTDEFGNPSLAFAGSYTLDIGTVPFPTPLAHMAPLGSLIYVGSFAGNIAPIGDTDSFTINVDAGQTMTIVAHPSPTADILWVGPNSLGWNDGTYGINQIDVSAFATASLAGYSLLVVDASAGGLSILQSRAADIAAFVAAGGGLITDNGGNFDFSWTPHAAGLSWVAQDEDTVLLTPLGGTHEVTAGLTNAGLSNWGLSQHTYFTATAGLDVLATNPTSNANILAGMWGSGHVVYFGLHPTGHQPAGESEQLIRQAVAWAKGPPPAPFVLDLKLFNPSNTLIGSSEIVGNDVIIQTAGPTVDGIYTVEVGAASGTGQYTIEIILNAAVEKESYGGPTNNSAATAENIDGSFIPLLPGATRGAVLGRTDAFNATVTVYSADFETTTGDNNWTIASVTNGLWHRSIGHGPEAGHSPTNSMYFGKGEKYNRNGSFTKGNYEVKAKGKPQVVAGTVTSPSIVLPGSGQVTLDFNYLLQTQGAAMLDLAQLQIKGNGGVWTTLASYNGVAESSVWRAADPVNISAFAGQTVQVRFSFDSVTAQLNHFEGWYVDDVRITNTVPHDNYSFTVGTGQNVTVVLKTLTPGDINVLLQNAAGTATSATGAAGPANVDKVIYNYPLAAGAYNLAITGQANTPFSLVVTLGAVFDVESNNNLGSAQPMGATKVALGYLEFQTGLSWVIEHQETVQLTALGNTHPVTDGLTNAGLSNWGNSQHSYFTETADLGILATNPGGQANILAGTVGGGRVAYFGLDPAYHQPTGDTQQLIRNAVTWTSDATPDATVDVLWVGPHSLSWNTIGAVVTQITIFDFATQSFAGFDVIYVDPDATSSGGASILHDRAGDIAAFVAAGGGLITDDGGSFDAPDFGWVPTGPGSDVYSFTASPGEIKLFTVTPGDGMGEPGNTLNPHLRLFDPSGAEVAIGVTTDAQGNEEIVYIVPSAGTYKIEITAEGGAGQYILDPVAVGALAAPKVVAFSSYDLTNLGAEAFAFAPRPFAVPAGAAIPPMSSIRTAAPAPVVLSAATATTQAAAIRGAIGQTVELSADAETGSAWQEPTPAVAPAPTDVPPTPPADEIERGDPAAAWQSSASAAIFADPNWQTTLPALVATAPPECADVPEPAADLAAVVVAFALLLDARRATAETRKNAAVDRRFVVG